MPALITTLRRHRSGLLVAGLLALLWLAIAAGLTLSNRAATERNEQLAAQVYEARSLAARVRALQAQRHPQPAASSLSLMTLTEQGAKRYKLDRALKQMDPQDEHHLLVTLRDARFDSMALWWGQLHTEAGVRVTQARINAGSASGLVSARATLSRQ